jgi:hypothetical protein
MQKLCLAPAHVLCLLPNCAGGRFEDLETLEWIDLPALNHLDFGCVSCHHWQNNSLPSSAAAWLATAGPAHRVTYLDVSTPPRLTDQQMLQILRWTGLEHLNFSRQCFPGPNVWPTHDGKSCCQPLYKWQPGIRCMPLSCNGPRLGKEWIRGLVTEGRHGGSCLVGEEIREYELLHKQGMHYSCITRVNVC